MRNLVSETLTRGRSQPRDGVFLTPLWNRSVPPYISFGQIVFPLACIFIKHSLGLTEEHIYCFLLVVIGRNGRTFSHINEPLRWANKARTCQESGIIIEKTGDFGAAE